MITIDQLLTHQVLDIKPAYAFQEGLMQELGQPTDYGKLGKQTIIIKYNNWQFTYNKEQLTLVACYKRGVKNKLEKKFFAQSIDQFTNQLDSMNLDWEIDETYPTSEDQTQINLASGTKVIIDLKEDELYAIMQVTPAI